MASIFLEFPDRLNLVICNMYNAKTSFLSFRASHFSIRNRSRNHVFFITVSWPSFLFFFVICFKNCPFWDPLRNPMGSKIRSGSAEGPSRACQDRFRHSLFLYLALHPTSHHIFFMLSHWVSVSAGNPAIAVARKVGVLGAPEIENGSKNRARNRPFFQ